MNTREPACGVPCGESIVHDRIRVACCPSKNQVSGKPLNRFQTSGEFRRLNGLDAAGRGLSAQVFGPSQPGKFTYYRNERNTESRECNVAQDPAVVHAPDCPPSKFGFNASRALSGRVSLDCWGGGRGQWPPTRWKVPASFAITSGFSLKTLLGSSTTDYHSRILWCNYHED